MKFDFNKIPKEEMQPEVLENSEMTQEEFDGQIESEALKLKTSVEELAKEIESYGGEQKFKERMEEMYEKSSKTTIGMKRIGEFENSIDKSNGDSKELSKFAGITLAIAGAMEVMFDKVSVHGDGIAGLVEKLHHHAEVSVGQYAEPALIASLIIPGVGMLYMALEAKLEENKTKRDLAKEKLKFKMTDVDPDTYQK